jgi:poly(A) polymerase
MWFKELNKNEVFNSLSKITDRLGLQSFVVGGFVRDYILGIKSSDIDIVVVGSGIDLAKEYCKEVGGTLSIYASYGTAAVKTPWGEEVEFVGARKESYTRGSRNPVVSSGSLSDDLGRRDFTINAMAICLCGDSRFGELIDMFNGYTDLQNGIIKTPVDPNITFLDDPLRSLRCIRFASRYGFKIEDNTWNGLVRNASLIGNIVWERISSEVCKILEGNNPKYGMELLQECGILKIILPEVSRLDTNDLTATTKPHKNNFWHSISVLDNVSKVSGNIWLRWAALLHDIGKESTKHYDPITGWSFYNHELVGADMIKPIFTRFKLPLGDEYSYVYRLVSMHMRPQTIANNEVTDSAVRRLCNDFGPGIEDLITLCECDITTKNLDKKNTFIERFGRVRDMIKDLQERDYIRLFQPVLGGDDIMRILNLRPGRLVGELKEFLKESILDGKIDNRREDLERLLIDKARDIGLI